MASGILPSFFPARGALCRRTRRSVSPACARSHATSLTPRPPCAGHGLKGGVGRCYAFFVDFSECMSKAGDPIECAALPLPPALPIACVPRRPRVRRLSRSRVPGVSCRRKITLSACTTRKRCGSLSVPAFCAPAWPGRARCTPRQVAGCHACLDARPTETHPSQFTCSALSATEQLWGEHTLCSDPTRAPAACRSSRG